MKYTILIAVIVMISCNSTKPTHTHTHTHTPLANYSYWDRFDNVQRDNYAIYTYSDLDKPDLYCILMGDTITYDLVSSTKDGTDTIIFKYIGAGDSVLMEYADGRPSYLSIQTDTKYFYKFRNRLNGLYRNRRIQANAIYEDSTIKYK